jgi:hypothetical protein
VLDYKLNISSETSSFLSRYRPYKSFSMQVLSCSSAFCLLATCGLLLRSQALLSAARSPNYQKTNPNIENDGPSDELNIVIVLVMFLLVFPVFIVIILPLRALSLLRNAAAVLRKSFGSLFARRTSSIPSTVFEETGSPKDFEDAVGALQRTDVEVLRKFPQKKAQPVTLNDIHVGRIDFCDGSEISARRTTLPHESTSNPT